jgi:nitrite reductase/ring-hydroxylating ferredoxin subunit
MSRGRRGRLSIWVVVAGVALGVIGFALVVTQLGSKSPGPGWVHATSVAELQRGRVVFVPQARAFVVAGALSPIALYAVSPHNGKPITHCDSSGWFEDRAHGSRFDGLGRYVLGPAPRGLDRFEVRVVDGEIWIDATTFLIGPPRGAPIEPPSGPFCATE